MGMLQNQIKLKWSPISVSASTTSRAARRPSSKLVEVVDFLKYPEKFTKVGAKTPRGVLLEGPPVRVDAAARAVAGRGRRALHLRVGSEFVEMFVGVGASRIRNLFGDAKNAPCIVFIDEIDAIGRQRSGGGASPRTTSVSRP